MLLNNLCGHFRDLTSSQSRFVLLLYSLVFLEIGIFIIVYLWWAYKFLTYPYQVDFGEGFLLFSAESFSQGKSIYQDISQFPYIPALYPPVYPLICAAFTKIIGVNFLVGRSLSFISAILTCLFIYLIVVRSAPKYVALISSLLFLASPYVMVWSLLYRVDTMALLFSFIGIYIILRYENSRLIYLSVFFFLLSVFTKQTLISAPLAASFYLLVKNPRNAVIFSGLFIIIGIIIFELLNHLTDGQFYIHLFTHHTFIDFSFRRAYSMYREFFFNHKFLFIFAFSCATYMLSTKKLSLFLFYFIFALITSITVGKTGSGVNYFMEVIAISCVLFGFMVEEINRKLRQDSIFQILVAAILAVQFVPNVHYLYIYSNIQDVKFGRKITDYVRQSTGDILTEDAGFAVLNGKVPVTEPFMAAQFSKNGLWDQSQLLNRLRNKNFSLAILKTNLNDAEYENLENPIYFTKEILTELKNNYKLVDQQGRYYIYKPSYRQDRNRLLEIY